MCTLSWISFKYTWYRMCDAMDEKSINVGKFAESYQTGQQELSQRQSQQLLPGWMHFFDRNRIVAIDGTLFEKYTEYSYYIEIILHFLFKERVKKIKLEFARG